MSFPLPEHIAGFQRHCRHRDFPIPYIHIYSREYNQLTAIKNPYTHRFSDKLIESKISAFTQERDIETNRDTRIIIVFIPSRINIFNL